MEIPLFVYGTLKRGQSNHGRLQGARWLGPATLPGACLYDLGPFPMAIAGEGHVHGELYAVSAAALPELDAFEGCPRLYQRHWLPLSDGRQAWVYLGQPRQVRFSRPLPQGEWPAPAEGNAAPLALARAWRRWAWALPLLCGLRLPGATAMVWPVWSWATPLARRTSSPNARRLPPAPPRVPGSSMTQATSPAFAALPRAGWPQATDPRPPSPRRGPPSQPSPLPSAGCGSGAASLAMASQRMA